MFKFLIHLLGGYTSTEYNQLSLEIDSLNNILAAKNNEIDHLKKESTDLSEKINKLQSQVDALSKIKYSFIIHVDGGKVWIENE